MGKIIDIQDGKLITGVDSDGDGKKSLSLEVDMSEVLGELFLKGEAKVDVKTLSFKMVDAKIVMELDTDKDGQPVLKGEVDLAESFDELQQKYSKKDPAPEA